VFAEVFEGDENDGGAGFLQRELAKLEDTPLKQGYFKLAMKSRFLAETSHFQNFIALVIVVAGVVVGLNTDGVMAPNDAIEGFILWIFVLEFLVKIVGEALDPARYFDDSWNRFDFFIVVMSFMPVPQSAVVILRLLRLLRVLKLLRVFPQLTLLVTALLNSFSSLGYIAMLLFLFFYVFAIVGNIAFGVNDPFDFGNVHLAMFALMRVATFEDWTDIMYCCRMRARFRQSSTAAPPPLRLERGTCLHSVWLVLVLRVALLRGARREQTRTCDGRRCYRRPATPPTASHCCPLLATAAPCLPLQLASHRLRPCSPLPLNRYPRSSPLLPLNRYSRSSPLTAYCS
jgi:hypothetical protein